MVLSSKTAFHRNGRPSGLAGCYSISCLLVLIGVAVDLNQGAAHAQPLATRSHRTIPSTQPQFDLREMLARTRQWLNLQNEQPLPPRVDGLDQLRPSTQEWLKALNQRSLTDLAEEFQEATGPVAEMPVPQIPDESPVDQSSWLREFLPDLQLPNLTETPMSLRELNRLYHQIRSEATKKQRRLDSEAAATPVDQDRWLDSLGPYLDRDTVKALAQASESASSKDSGKPSDHGATNIEGPGSSSPSSQALTRSDWLKRPKSTVDSIVQSIDEQGSAWIQRLAKSDIGSSTWKELSGSSKRKVREIARRWSRKAKSLSQDIDAIGPPAPSTSAPRLPSLSPGARALGVGSALAVVCILVMWTFQGRLGSLIASKRRLMNDVSLEQVTDRESFVEACNLFLFQTLGEQCSFWNHVRLFRSLREWVRDDHHIAEQVAAYYERARYSDVEFTSRDLQHARQLFAQLCRLGTDAG